MCTITFYYIGWHQLKYMKGGVSLVMENLQQNDREIYESAKKGFKQFTTAVNVSKIQNPFKQALFSDHTFIKLES